MEAMSIVKKPTPMLTKVVNGIVTEVMDSGSCSEFVFGDASVPVASAPIS
jgi:hypothetical protein